MRLSPGSRIFYAFFTGKIDLYCIEWRRRFATVFINGGLYGKGITEEK